MSDALGKPWIESAVNRVLVEHAHELPSPPELRGRAQIVRFLTFREDPGDRRQPTDRDTVLWAEITDRQWVMPIRIANEVTNKLEDEHKRALTYFRRGFFTLKAAVAYDFITEQISIPGGGSRMQRPNRKSIVLDIVELNYISGGGPGAPVASNSVALQTFPGKTGWEDALSIGGRTLANHQAKVKIVLESESRNKTSLRRTASNSAGRTGNKGSGKTSAPVLPHQPPSNDKLGAFHQWQDAYWGRRHKYRDMHFEFSRGEFDIPGDQQAILQQIEERIKNATLSQPYNPTNSTNGPLSAPDRQIDLPSFRSSQIYTSTPLDARRPPSSPAASQAPYDFEEEEVGGLNPDDEAGDDRSEISLGRRARSPDSGPEGNEVSRAASEVDEPLGTDAEDVERDPQLLSHPDNGSEKSLEPDDAVSEKILNTSTQTNTPTETEFSVESRAPPRQPIVLVPDSDPQGSSQVQPRPTQVRGSSPWEIESSPPSRMQSPEVARINKGKRRYSPTLSSPMLQPSSGLPGPSQLPGQPSEQQKGIASSGQSTSQESAAAASLPSPPPEYPPTQSTPSQPHNRFATPITNEPIIQNEHSRNERHSESFDTVPRAGPDVRPSPNPRKRRRSMSRTRDGGLTLASIGGVAVATRDPETEVTKRRRLGDSDARLTTESVVSREDTSETRALQTGNTKGAVTNVSRSDLNGPNPQAARVAPPNPRIASPSDPTVIPHDHDAWAAPSYLAAQAKSPEKTKAAKGTVGSSSRAVSVSSPVAPIPVLPSRQMLKPKPRFAPPPSFSRAVLQRAISPQYPQVTASQVADADEDEDVEMQPSPSVKIEPPTPARPTKSPASILSTIPSRPHASISYVGSKSTEELPAPVLRKAAQASTAAGAAGTRGGQTHPTTDNTSAKSKAQQEPRRSKSRVSGSSSNRSSEKGKGVELPEGSGTQRKLLGGFSPSLSPSLENRFISTWDMWLTSVREAELFWQDVDSDPEL